MSFEKQCACTKHSEWLVEGATFLLKPLSQRPFKKEIVEYLVSESVLPKRAKYLCTQCAIHCEENVLGVKKKIVSDVVQGVITNIEPGQLSKPELISLAEALGNSQKHSFCKDAESSAKNYKKHINDFDCDMWLRSTNIVLLSFLSSITGFSDTADKKPKLKFALTAAVDCLMAVANVHTVTPLFFALNLTVYFISGSKTICSFLSSFTPSGSYYCVKSWFDKISELPIINVFPKIDIVTYFDNSQILSRNWRVRYQAKALVSVITSVLHNVPAKKTNLQYNPDLSPRNWFYNECKQINILAHIDKCSNQFKSERNRFLTDIMNEVLLDRVNDPDIVDDMDSTIPKGLNNDNKYSFIDSCHSSETPTANVGEPCIVNPCSYEAVERVLSHLLSTTNVGEGREWTVIGCDGLPYLLASRIIDNAPELQNILLQPGLGHIEINMTKSLFKLLWEVCLSDVARMLGYSSINAQVSCKNAGDHHKSMQILTIFLYGTAKELIVPFIDYCEVENCAPSLALYHVWLSNIKDSTFQFMQEVVFTYTYALFLFRSAIRRNNSLALECGRKKFAPLFYGLNQTCYQELEYRDTKMRLMAPQPVAEFLQNNESCSLSGDSSKGEGGDFVLEAANRRLKMMMPPGLPTEQRWIKICRSFDELNKVRKHLAQCLGEEEKDSGYMYHGNLDIEIVQWRRRLRSVEYLSRPFIQRDHVSVSGQPLDHELVKFSQHCKGNMQLYLEDIEAGKNPGKGARLTPVFITPDDRGKFRSIRNKTVKEIETLIIREIHQIEEMGYTEEAHSLTKTWKGKVKCGTKDVHITFYRGDVCLVLDQCLQEETILGDDTEDGNCR